MKRRMRLMLSVLAIGAAGTAVMALTLGFTPSVWKTPPPPEPVVVAPQPIVERLTLQRGDTLDVLLSRAGLDANFKQQTIDAVTRAFDVKKFRAGAELTLVRSAAGTFQSLEYLIDPDHKLRVSQTLGGLPHAAVLDVPGVVRPTPVCATLEGSLFESLQRSGESPELATQMAEIFAWDIDFYRDPQQGDEFCLLVEKKEYLNGQPATYKKILAASYTNVGTRYEAFLFPDPEGKPHYYSRDGRSLQSSFLRSPLKFDARVSSRFTTRRFHPVLKTYRPHWGTDYAAPVGTPVHSVAAGRVTFSGYSGGSGNLVKVVHSGGYETQYLHLSKRLVRNGEKVSQGQRIGLVGATGLASGPHLDIRIQKDGRYVNFEKLRAPRVAVVPPGELAAFRSERDRFAAMMDPAAENRRTVLARSEQGTAGQSATSD